MEVREERIRRQELEPWIDEKVRFSGPGRNSTFMRGRFHRAHGRRANRDPSLCALNRFGCRLRYRPRLRMEFIFFDGIVGQGLKRSKANVQSDTGELGSSGLTGLDHLRRKVETRRGGGDRASVLGENGLIPLPVLWSIQPVDVGREWHMADAEKFFVEITLPFQANPAFSPDASFKDLRTQARSDLHVHARMQMTSGAHKRAPITAFRIQRTRQENFDLAGISFLASKQSRGEHLRVVNDQAVARAEHCGQIAKHAILPRPGGPVDHQHARSVALREWFLCDQFSRQFIIKFRELHYPVSRILLFSLTHIRCQLLAYSR